jgi:predicted secreted hydrolase
MDPWRRRWLLQVAGLPGAMVAAAAHGAESVDCATSPQGNGCGLEFPRDHGAHLDTRTEWWYATGWLGRATAPTHGFQVTFFRIRTGLAEQLHSRFAARQLLFADAAVTALAGGGHLHDHRIVRWSGEQDAALGCAAVAGGDLKIGNWTLRDDGRRWHAEIPASGFSLRLGLSQTQPLLLQGHDGISRKGPGPGEYSHYYSEPQLAADGSVTIAGRGVEASGSGWLDHEWSDRMLPAQAVGWVWIGINLFDGSALTAFVLRRADASSLWAGGSFRRPRQVAADFAPSAVRFSPGRRWRSAASGASYPVQWEVATPAGRFEVRALQDAQEVDSRAGTGAIYWEGLSELRDAQGRRVGLGYLEMTGYARPLRL